MKLFTVKMRAFDEFKQVFHFYRPNKLKYWIEIWIPNCKNQINRANGDKTDGQIYL